MKLSCGDTNRRCYGYDLIIFKWVSFIAIVPVPQIANLKSVRRKVFDIVRPDCKTDFLQQIPNFFKSGLQRRLTAVVQFQRISSTVFCD